MKRICLILVLVIIFSVIAHAQSKITFKWFDDPTKSGLESIIFEYDTLIASQNGDQTQGVTRVFDIQQNNPFNDLNQKTLSISPNGSKVKEFSLENREQDFKLLGLKYDPLIGSSQVPLTGSSHVMMSSGRDKNMAIAYNIFFSMVRMVI